MILKLNHRGIQEEIDRNSNLFHYHNFSEVIFFSQIYKLAISNAACFNIQSKKLQYSMNIRKVQTRGGTRQQFYHETQTNYSHFISNDVIRPPTSHPYSGYKSKKSQSQMRAKYSPNFFLDAKLETKLQANIRQLKSSYQSSVYIDKLPQSFKLIINQIRVFMKNATNSKMNEFDDLIQNLAKSIADLLQQQSELLKNKDTSQKQMNDLNNRISELEKKTNKNEVNCEIRRVNRKFDSIYKKQQEVLVQNCRLGELNARYLARIAELENNRVEKIVDTTNYKQSQTKIDTQLLRCHNRISYLEMKLGTAEKVEHQLRSINQKLNKQLIQSKNRLQAFEREYVQNTEKMNEWRERAMMQRQDGEIHISRQQFLLYSLKKLKENNKNLLNKLLEANKSDERIQKRQFEQNPNFDYEMDFFKNIRAVYEKGKAQKVYSHEEVKKNQLGLEIEEVSLEIDYQNYKKSDSFDVSTLKYYRPSFYSFIEEAANPQLAQSRTKCSNSVSRVFIQVLRSIMASKLNEFMFAECPEKFTRFPEFVYAWFEKFYFNTEKNCVCVLEPFMQKPITQELFYKDLMNVRLDQSWEIITFREFILEELSLQELYFYLMCQMLLYSRAGITKQTQCQGDFCVLVQYSAAKSVLDITLNDFESWNITFLTSKLREKIINKKNKEYIQAGFFLRCLLQYYRIQRSNRYRYISKLCSEFHDKKGLRFSSFMSVINKFTEVSTQIKLKLYRDCYCLTKGVITPQSIFIVCSEEMIFLKHLKIKSFFRLPKIIQRPTKLNIQLQNQSPEPIKAAKQMICLQPPDPYLYDIILGFTHIINSPESITKRIQTIGVSEFNHQILSLIRALDDRNSQIGSNVLKCKHFLHYFSNAIEIVRRVTYYNFYQLLEEEAKRKTKGFWVQINDQDVGSIFAQEFRATFQTYNKINNLRIWKDKVYNFRLNNSAKKIQKQVKKKFIEPYLQIYNYFSIENKQGKQDQTKQAKK